MGILIHEISHATIGEHDVGGEFETELTRLRGSLHVQRRWAASPHSRLGRRGSDSVSVGNSRARPWLKRAADGFERLLEKRGDAEEVDEQGPTLSGELRLPREASQQSIDPLANHRHHNGRSG